MMEGAFFERSFESDTVPRVMDNFPRVVALVVSSGPSENAGETLDSPRRARYANLETFLLTDDGRGVVDGLAAPVAPPPRVAGHGARQG